MGMVAGPLLLIIEAVGWFLTLRSPFISPRSLGGACFGLLFRGSIAAFGGYVFLDRIAPRRYLYVRDGSLRFRAEVMNFRCNVAARTRTGRKTNHATIEFNGEVVGKLDKWLSFRIPGNVCGKGICVRRGR